MWEIKRIYAICGLFNIETPTVPTINIGPEFDVKEHILCASCLVIKPWENKSAVIFAPSG